MKKSIILILTIIFFFETATSANNIVFIDMDKILSSSKPGSNILEQLNDLNNSNLDNFKKKQIILKDEEIKIVSQKNILSLNDYNNKVNDLKIKINDYNLIKNKTTSEFQKKKVDNINIFFKQINPILSKYSKDKSISIILQKKNMIMGKKELDITNEIIKIINDEIKEFKIK
jgi:outer membrane protein